ncbi:MAG: glycosyltransferase [Pseudomonadota bacterium]
MNLSLRPEPTPAGRQAAPGGGVAAIVTAHKIGPVLSDTVLSILGQRGVALCAVVVVVDGCPFVSSTQSILRRLALAHPNMHVLWLQNGGVSRARNRGIDWLMQRYPDLEAVFLIDGDDLVGPDVVHAGLSLLRDAPPDAGWVYLDQQEFGAGHRYLRYPSAFEPSRWLVSNLSQPSCLYAGAMFRAGLRWDEGMRQGIEDWEFWYQAMAAGFRGIHDPDSLLHYRRLSGNRSSVNRKNDALTKRYMRTKHQPLLAPRAALAAEQARFPRYALWQPDTGTWACTTDPLTPVADKSTTTQDLRGALAARAAQPAWRSYFFDPYFPDIAISLPAATAQRLQDARLTHLVAAKLEQALAEGTFCTLSFGDETGDGVTIHASVQDRPVRRMWKAAGLAVNVGRLVELVRTGQPARAAPPKGRDRRLGQAWRVLREALRASIGRPPRDGRPDLGLGSIRKNAELRVHDVAVALPGATPPGMQHRAMVQAIWQAAEHAMALIADRQAIVEANAYCGSDKANHANFYKELIGLPPPLPLPPHPDRIDVALLLPQDGPAPPLLTPLIAALDAATGGALRLHVTGLGAWVPDIPPGAAPFAGSRLALDVDVDTLRRTAKRAYHGVPAFEDLPAPILQHAAARLIGMDAVLNFCGPAAAGPLMRVRGAGVITATVVDAAAPWPAWPAILPDTDPWEAADLEALAAQAYTGANTHLVVPDPAATHRLRALGVPAARLDPGGQAFTAALAERLADRRDSAAANQS